MTKRPNYLLADFGYNQFMNTKLIITILVALLIVGGEVYFIYETPAGMTPTSTADDTDFLPAVLPSYDGKNSSFMIDDTRVTLKNGVSEISAASDSSSKITTKYFGNESEGDLNGDGQKDIAFLVTQDADGSGTFFYAVVALKTATGYKTTNAFLIGDRISPQRTEINESAHELYVNFAERKPSEPMTTQPSVGATLYLKVTSSGVLEGVSK